MPQFVEIMHVLLLSGDAAARFIRHMRDDRAVPVAQATLDLSRTLFVWKFAAYKPAGSALQ